MKNIQKITVLTVAALIGVAGTASADGMKAAPKPVISPLEKAVNDIQQMQPPALNVPPSKIEADEPLPQPVAAQVAPESRTVEVQDANPSYFGLSVGVFDPLRESERSVALNAEYQPGVKIAGVLQPIFGAMVTTGSAVMGYAGVGVPFKVTEKIQIMPSVAAAVYHNGADYDLGQMLNLRAGGEIAYVLDNKSRIGLGGYVLTNLDSTEKRDRTGMILVSYTTPTSIFSGKSGR